MPTLHRFVTQVGNLEKAALDQFSSVVLLHTPTLFRLKSASPQP